ncbi:hypothetical protein OAF98_02770 [Planctomicrobium sp.]|jgi:hypothetical protein|nr:hypothetical protein [Planctomicrobium sp.]MBT5019848.1 hypothetical protein [Planctomicrobium sp.]MDB4439383.1 hypothetical protein [Planctomicrobium sp.]MDB4743384.1 hypothetical protein [Planctomicrobium sp.]
MAHAYTPGLQIKDRIGYRISRVLPIDGEVLVEQGEQVQPDQIIARTEQPGNIYPVNLANQLGITAGEVPEAMNFQIGEHVTEGEQLAISNGIFGFFRNSCKSPATGTIESMSNITGQVIIRGAPIPVEVDAFVAGKVAEVLPGQGAVIETNAAFMQGIFGIGGETRGTLTMICKSPDEDLTPQKLSAEHTGAIVVGGRRILGETVARAKELGIAAIIGGGIDDQDLKDILGYDLGVAITGSEEIGLTLIVTEGFGQIAMAKQTFQLLQSLAGKVASVNGATQIRAGVLRPEIVIPLEDVTAVDETAQKVGGGVLEIGSHVRLIRDPYFGVLGKVSDLPTEPQVLESGSKARILKVNCESGEEVTVPRANVELVGDQS